MKRVVVTGLAAITPIGSDWVTVSGALRDGRTGIRTMEDWAVYDGLNTRLGAPVTDFERPAHFSRKTVRSMGRVAMMATRVSELALEDAGLVGEDVLTGGRAGVAYGSSAGTPDAVQEFGTMLNEQSTSGINANTYIKMMSHTAPVNIAIYFALRGRVLTTSSACTSGSQGIGYAYEAIRAGQQDVMVAGGAEELSATGAAVFDTLYATSTRNDTPEQSPRPFDADRDGLVVGEGAATLVLEEYEHALARGATMYAEVVGYGTNCDGAHITQPNRDTMAVAMELALADQGINASQIGYVSAHGTATDLGDVAESHATQRVLGTPPISAMKSYTGHTLGACGSMEAWATIHMMREGWFHATANLDSFDPECAELDYVTEQGGRSIDCEYTMSNNFAFGGVNTSLIFRRLA